MLAPGQLAGPYRVLSIIGAGAMGTVYLARDEPLGRRRAESPQLSVGSDWKKYTDWASCPPSRLVIQLSTARQLAQAGAVGGDGHDRDGTPDGGHRMAHRSSAGATTGRCGCVRSTAADAPR